MRRPVKHPSVLLTLMLIAVCWAATLSIARAAQSHQPLAEIREAARELALAAHGHGDNVKVEPASLDRRLRLARCEQPLHSFWAPGSKNVGGTTIGVRCDGARPWKLYVPTRVSVVAPVAITARPLTRGHRIGPGDLKLAQRDLSSLRADAVRDPALVQGYVLTRAVSANRALTPRMLEAPRLVERGREVRVILDAQGLTVRMTGVALEDGARGEMVRIRNPGSKRIVHAQVIAPGVVSIRVPTTASR